MEQAINEFNRTKGKMVADFKSIINDADELLQATAKVSGEGFNVTREKFAEKIKTAKVSMEDAEQIVMDKAKQIATVSDEYVKTNPWTSVGVAAGLGLLIGFLASKR